MTDASEDAYSAYMAERQASHGARTALGPSAASKCFRQAAFEYLQVPPTDERSTAAADLGTLLHLGWSAMIRAQYDPAERAPDVPLHAEGMPRGGEANDVDYVHRKVRDVKSTKARVWEMWQRNGVFDSFWEQLEVYALALRQLHGGDWTMCVVAINRETGQIEEYERPADPEVGRALVDKIAARHDALTAAAVNVLTSDDADALHVAASFPREGAGPGRGMPCDWCSFVSVCWPSPTSPDGTPQSATVDPDDQAAIASLASEYLSHSAIAKKHYAARDDAKVFLAGLDTVVPDPQDPGYELTVKMAGGNPKLEVDCVAAADRLTELGVQVPMRETFTARFVKVGRRRTKKPA